MKQGKLEYQVNADDFSRAGEVSYKAREALRRLGVPADAIRRACICMYEGEINMILHADGGLAEVVVGLDNITIRLADTGPGIPDVEKAMTEGWTTGGDLIWSLGFGAGMGLSNMKRYSDSLQVNTMVGEGTTVTMKINVA